MKTQFELAGGSIIGREHLRVGKNNQDAYGWTVADESAIAVVCDGCGSGQHSEVGAKLGARFLLETLQRVLTSDAPLDQPEFWQAIQQSLLHQLQIVVDQLGGDRLQTVREYLLFTLVGAVITPTLTAIIALGDGVTAMNDHVMPLAAFANNAPPYLGYGLLSQTAVEQMPLRVLQVLPTEQMTSVLIGTDGVGDLIDAATKPLPGRSEIVGDLAQFWQDDRYFHNPDQVRRRLALINRDVMTFDPQTQRRLQQSGLLPDDTTLIVIRRKEAVC